MIKIEKVVTPSSEQWKSVIFGTRNAMNSWEKSDSYFDCETCFCKDCVHTDENHCGHDALYIGENDHDLMMRLAKNGSVHGKYRRMITVYVDITAPLYWWKEFDTYKVGTVANSCSTMHKIHEKEFTLDDFSHEHLIDDKSAEVLGLEYLEFVIGGLNKHRNRYLQTKDKKHWWQMIQLLPSSYNQRRTVMLNYEVLANIYCWRKDHKLDEWRELCKWIEELPYSELITGEDTNQICDKYNELGNSYIIPKKGE